MAASNEESVEVGLNEERCLCGLLGDDDDDDLREDHEVLFGGQADDAVIDIKDGDVPPPPEEGGVVSVLVPLVPLFGKTLRSCSRPSMVSRSGMELVASTALRSTLVDLVVVLVISVGIFSHVLSGVRKLAWLSLKSLSVLMVVCVVGTTVLK